IFLSGEHQTGERSLPGGKHVERGRKGARDVLSVDRSRSADSETKCPGTQIYVREIESQGGVCPRCALFRLEVDRDSRGQSTNGQMRELRKVGLCTRNRHYLCGGGALNSADCAGRNVELKVL